MLEKQAGQQKQGEQVVVVVFAEEMLPLGDSRLCPQLHGFAHSSIHMPYWLNESAERKMQESTINSKAPLPSEVTKNVFLLM